MDEGAGGRGGAELLLTAGHLAQARISAVAANGSRYWGDCGDDPQEEQKKLYARVDESAANTTMSMVTMNDQIDVELDPDISPPHPYQQLPPLQNARIGISGRAKINTLKKYLIMKLGMKDTSISALSSKVVSSSSSLPTMIELTSYMQR